MRPGLALAIAVVPTRTLPLDSWIMVARMKRASTPVEEEMERMEAWRSEVSSGVLGVRDM